MDKLTDFINLLGEENANELRRRIVDIICNTIEEDFQNREEYILPPAEIDEFAEECLEIAKKNVAQEYISQAKMCCARLLPEQ